VTSSGDEDLGAGTRGKGGSEECTGSKKKLGRGRGEVGSLMLTGSWRNGQKITQKFTIVRNFTIEKVQRGEGVV